MLQHLQIDQRPSFGYILTYAVCKISRVEKALNTAFRAPVCSREDGRQQLVRAVVGALGCSKGRTSL